MSVVLCHEELGDPWFKVTKTTAYFVDFAVPGLLLFRVYRGAISGAILFTVVACSVTLCDYSTSVFVLLHGSAV
jgi:hypothetical protein